MPEIVAPPDPTGTGAEMGQYLKQVYTDPLNVTPEMVYVLLNYLKDETDRIKYDWVQDFFDVDLEASVHINNDLARWEELLGQYFMLTAQALESGMGPVDPAGRSQYYKDVVGPLIDGMCYGEPSCTQSIADQYAPFGFPIVPTATHIFTIQMAMGVAKEASISGFQTLVDYAYEEGVALANAGKEVLEEMAKGAAKAAGDLLGAGVEGFAEGLGDAVTKLLWGLGALAGLAGIIWIAGKSAAAAGANK